MLRFDALAIECQVPDPQMPEEVPQLFSVIQRLLRKNGNGAEWDVIAAQQFDPAHYPIESATPGAVHPVAIVKEFRAVQADSKVNIPLSNEVAPLLADQGCVCLKRMFHLNRRWGQLLHDAERRAVELYGQCKRFPSVPRHHEFIGQSLGLCEEEPARLLKDLIAHPAVQVAVWKIAIGAVDIAERRRLNDSQMDLEGPGIVKIDSSQHNARDSSLLASPDPGLWIRWRIQRCFKRNVVRLYVAAGPACCAAFLRKPLADRSQLAFREVVSGRRQDLHKLFRHPAVGPTPVVAAALLTRRSEPEDLGWPNFRSSKSENCPLRHLHRVL